MFQIYQSIEDEANSRIFVLNFELTLHFNKNKKVYTEVKQKKQ